MSVTTKIRVPVYFGREARGRRVLVQGRPPADIGHVPRLARLMALAIRIEDRVRTGQLRDFAHAAELGHVTRARLTQIMDLTLLAPDIQEEILFMEPVRGVRDAVSERLVRPIAKEPDWRCQRAMRARTLQHQRDTHVAANTRSAVV